MRRRVVAIDRVVVLGLGRFGRSLAYTLHELGYEVTAIDMDPRVVEEASAYVSLAAQGDCTDEELLRSLEVDKAAVGVVAQGGNLEASLLSTLQLKRIGVRRVIAKATSDLHGELLKRIGADRVIFPERDEGNRLAHAIAVPSINDYISLSPTSGIAKFNAPPRFVGKTLQELHAAAHTNLSVFAIKRGNLLINLPSFEEQIQRGDELVVSGPDAEIEGFIAPQLNGQEP